METKSVEQSSFLILIHAIEFQVKSESNENEFVSKITEEGRESSSPVEGIKCTDLFITKCDLVL